MNIGGAEAIFLLLFIAIAIGGTVLWIWALIDAVRVPDDSMYRAGNKLVWVLVIVFLHVIGAIVYLAVGRPSSASTSGSSSRVPPPPPPR